VPSSQLHVHACVGGAAVARVNDAAIRTNRAWRPDRGEPVMTVNTPPAAQDLAVLEQYIRNNPNVIAE
jgi:hypothetical protein